jgi:hypothetical protein
MDTLYLQQQIDSLKIRLSHFDYLNAKLDSIQHSQNLNEINFKLNETANIINNVNSFYESAWLKLIIIITVIGVVVPIIIQYFQRKSNKELFDKYSLDFENKLNEKINLIEKNNGEKFKELTDEYNKEIQNLRELNKKQINESDANIFYLQGRVRVNEKNYVYALNDFVISAEKYLKTENTKRAIVQLNFIVVCLKHIENKSEFERGLKINKLDWELFIAKFCTPKNREIYKESITKINNIHAKFI